MTYTPIAAGTPDWDVPLNAALSDQDTRITQNAADINTNTNDILTLDSEVDTNTTDIATNTADIATNTADISTLDGQMTTANSNISTLQGQMTTAQADITALQGRSNDSAVQGFISWDYDPENVSGSGNILTSGTIYLHKLYLQAGTTVNSIAAGIQVAGSTLTAGQSLMGIYNSAGTRVGVTADQSASWVSPGYKSAALTSPYSVVTAGFHHIALLSVGTTPPTFYSTNAPSSLFNGNTSGATLRHATNATAQTTLPSSLTLSSNVSTSANSWAAAL